MDSDAKKLRFLEGIGYAAAFMIGGGGLAQVMGLTQVKVLGYFNVLGLVFAVIVIIRLMVMNVSLGLVHRLYEPPSDLDSEMTESAGE
jgi:hypothetical protein